MSECRFSGPQNHPSFAFPCEDTESPLCPCSGEKREREKHEEVRKEECARVSAVDFPLVSLVCTAGGQGAIGQPASRLDRVCLAPCLPTPSIRL